MLQKQRRLAWTIGAGMTLALFLCVFGWLDVYLAVNDDSTLLRAFLGYGTGTPANFHIFIHGILTWPLYWLSCAFPGVAWFSYLQLFMLFVSLTIICKSIMQCFVQNGKPIWQGAMLSLLFLIAFGVENVARFTFTVTASMLGAAAVLNVLSQDYERASERQVILTLMGSAALVILAYALRQITLIPVLAFCGIAFLYVFAAHFGLGKKQKRSPRPMLISLTLIIVLIGGVLVWREAEIQANDAEEYLRWNDARVYSVDYYGLAQMKQEDIDVAGWSNEAHALAHDWCFLPLELSTENFERLNEYLQAKRNPSLMDHLRQAKKELLYQINRVMQREYRLLAVVVVLGVSAGAGALFYRKRRITLLLILGMTAAALGSMLIYLGTQGRMPLRATLSPTLPAMAVICGLLPACFPEKRAAKKILTILMAAGIAHSIYFVSPAVPQLVRDEMIEKEVQAFADLESYALKHPESLFLYDNSFSGADVRPFPDYSQGIPVNVASWGGWEMGSARNREQFARFGIDLDTFEANEMLRDDLFIAAISADSDGPLLMEAWIESELGCDVSVRMKNDAENVFLFQFSLAEQEARQ